MDLPHFALTSVLWRLRRILPTSQMGRLRVRKTELPRGDGAGREVQPRALALDRQALRPCSACRSKFKLPSMAPRLLCPSAATSHTPLPRWLCQTVSSHACPAQTVPSGGKRPSPHGPSSACMLLFVLLFCDRPRVGTERLFAHSVSTAPAPSASALMCMGLASSFRFRSGQVTQALPIAH